MLPSTDLLVFFFVETVNVNMQASNKRKAEGTSANFSTIQLPKRLARKDSLPAQVISILNRHSSSEGFRSSYEIDLPPSASRFSEKDMEALNANFKSASREDEVIPDIQGKNCVIVTILIATSYLRSTLLVTNFPNAYTLSSINRAVMANTEFDIVNIDQVGDGRIKSFINKLHEVVTNARDNTGRRESKIDSLVDHLLNHVINFVDYPLEIRCVVKRGVSYVM